MTHKWWIIIEAVDEADFNLSKALDCGVYTFVDNAGVAKDFSSRCNTDFLDTDGDNCDDYSNEGWCNWGSEAFIVYSTKNSDGVFETGLQCPQCGCGEDGAASLYSVQADSGNRKPADGKNPKGN